MMIGIRAPGRSRRRRARGIEEMRVSDRDATLARATGATPTRRARDESRDSVGFSEGLATTRDRDASSTRETIARAFLTSFPNFERVARANSDAMGEDVRDLAHLADSDRLRRARDARPRRRARRDRDQSRMRRVAARSRARERRARRARRVHKCLRRDKEIE